MIVALALAGVPAARPGMACTPAGVDRGMKMGGHRRRRRRRATGGHSRPGQRQEGSCTGTTRWCPGRSSTSPANRRSWTCSSCRCTPTSAGDGRHGQRSVRACSRTSACALAEVTQGHARADGRGGRHRRVQRARRGASSRRAATASSSGSMCGRRSTRCARASRWPSSTFPTGSRRRRNISAAQPHARGAGSLDGLVDGARQRMRLAGMSDEQIAAVEASGKVQPRMTVTAPIGGVVAELAAREGMTVMAGAPLFRINGLGTVWVNAEVPESLAAHVRPGNAGRGAHRRRCPASVQGQGQRDPARSESPRRARSRRASSSPIPAAQLVPGMFATVNFAPAARQGRAAGADRSGDPDRQAQRRHRRAGRRQVRAGRRRDRRRKRTARPRSARGSQAGQKVVVSGQFLIDSEASLKGVDDAHGETRRPAQPPAPTGRRIRATARSRAIDKDEIMLSHGPIAVAASGAR